MKQISFYRSDDDGEATDPTETLLESYENQWLRFTWQGATYALRAAWNEDVPTAGLPEGMLGNSEWLSWVSTSRLIRRSETVEEMVAEREVWKVMLEKMGGPYALGITYGASGWFEGALLIEGNLVSGELVSQSNSHQYFYKWDDAGLHLVSTLDNKVVKSAPAVLTRLPEGCCPLKPFDDSKTQCEMVGGPFTGRSMRVAGEWTDHRQALIQMAGCEVCNDGKTPLKVRPGTPIGIFQFYLSSRLSSGWFSKTTRPDGTPL